MKIVIECDKTKSFYPEDIEGENPFEIGPFIDKGENNTLYLPTEDEGNGPFWLRVENGFLSAYAAENVSFLFGPLVSVDPTITINY